MVILVTVALGFILGLLVGLFLEFDRRRRRL